MKGRETSKSPLTGDLFYLYEGPRDHQKPPEEESRRGICSTYMNHMKGRETSISRLTRNLFYLYEGPRDPRSLPQRNLFDFYEGPRDFQEPLNK